MWKWPACQHGGGSHAQVDHVTRADGQIVAVPCGNLAVAQALLAA
jgi:hypothetical protein